MALKRKNHEIETELSNTLNTIEEEMTKTISTEIATIEARIATLSGQLDHIRGQHGEVQQLRAEVVASIDAAEQLASEKTQAQKTNETVTAELLSVKNKVKAAESKLSEVVKAEEAANETQETIDKEEQEKLEAIQAEKVQLLQKREALTGPPAAPDRSEGPLTSAQRAFVASPLTRGGLCTLSCLESWSSGAVLRAGRCLGCV